MPSVKFLSMFPLRHPHDDRKRLLYLIKRRRDNQQYTQLNPPVSKFYNMTAATINSFTDLVDTPDDYTDAANKILRVNTTGTAVEFIDPVLPTNAVYYLTDTASDIADTKAMITTYAGSGSATATKTISADDTLIANWATPEGSPNATVLQGGVFEAHIHAFQSSGTKTSTIYFKVYKTDDDGSTSTLLATSEETSNISKVAATSYSIHAYITEQAITTDDRIIVKFYGNEGGAGTDPVVVIYYQDDTLSRFSFPATIVTTVPPGGSDTHVQFNDSGAFGGDDGLTYTKATEQVVIGSGASLAAAESLHTEGGIVIDAGGLSATAGNLTLADGVVYLAEQAAAEADVAGKGQIWVKTGTPNTLWFTDDEGTDFQLGV